jgi:hypothetical protein
MSGSLENNIKGAVKNNFNIEVVCGTDGAMVFQFGVRLRPFGKKAPKNVMFWGTGKSLEEALDNAVLAVKKDVRLELDWSYRPWEVEGQLDATNGPAWR